MLTDERLEEMRFRARILQGNNPGKSLWKMQTLIESDALALLAEVERLRERETALAEVVQAVARGEINTIEYGSPVLFWRRDPDDVKRLYALARALLGD